MFCPHCEQTILGALSGLPGLSNVRSAIALPPFPLIGIARFFPKTARGILANHGYTLKARVRPFGMRSALRAALPR
ncbi:MAG: heavy-metal-associated domain-containing protein [Christensenellales bacterium]